LSLASVLLQTRQQRHGRIQPVLAISLLAGMDNVLSVNIDAMVTLRAGMGRMKSIAIKVSVDTILTILLSARKRKCGYTV
jgi:hypothetical protein